MSVTVEPRAIRIEDAARMLGISRGLAYELVRTGDLPTIRLGKKRLVVPTSRLNELLEGKRTEPTAA